MGEQELWPQEYLEFIELFNSEQFFESHEVLELLWRKDKGPSCDFYHGLIQIAAVFVHLQKQTPKGAERLHQTASNYLRPYGSFYSGLEIEKLLSETKRAIFEAGEIPKIILKK